MSTLQIKLFTLFPVIFVIRYYNHMYLEPSAEQQWRNSVNHCQVQNGQGREHKHFGNESVGWSKEPCKKKKKAITGFGETNDIGYYVKSYAHYLSFMFSLITLY